MKINYLFLGALALLSACTTTFDADMPQSSTAVELKGISATISQGAAATRAVTKLSDEVGRTAFVTDDKIVFTNIQRTDNPLEKFTYKNILYQYTASDESGSWSRVGNDPEKLYWTDGSSFHTFIGYCLPSADIAWTAGTDGVYTGHLTTTDFTKGNDVMAKEDLLLCYNDDVKSPDGASAAVTLTHALSNVRVIVNIKDFAASSNATDVDAKVSNMQLLGQPINYVWDGKIDSLKVADDDTYNQTINLWCPKPQGDGDAQSRTFTFYGLAVPNGQEQEFSFTVSYPDALNPQKPVRKTYQGKFGKKVYFHSGKCTTLNITLNHQNEQIFTGAQYSDWSFVATPDLGELRKKTTYVSDGLTVKICNDGVCADDATWLYKDSSDNIYDIYGNDGSASKPYCITSAQQMLSFAKEVNEGNLDFKGKYVRLDADITMQSSSTATGYTWTSIGTDEKPFEGTFLGGDRFINRLSGNPLFAAIGESACVEQLQITCVGDVANGALAKTNNGVIGGCRVIDDVKITGEGAGALVGTNTGTIHASYYTGAGNLVGTNNDGDKTGTIVGCYQASDITSFTKEFLTNFIDGTDGENPTNGLNDDLNAFYSNESNSKKFRTKFNYTFTPGSYPTVIIR